MRKSVHAKPWRAPVAALLGMTMLASPAGASRLGALAGHLSLGYAKLFATDAPGGSLSVDAGLDVPVASSFRAGVGLGYHLLGTRTVERGSLIASVDYSAFEALGLVHWLPRRLGPIERISAGVGIVSAHADLSTSGGGAGFSDLAVAETAPGFGANVTLMSHRPSPVRVGAELGTRVGLLAHDTWTLATVRFVIHY